MQPRGKFFSLSQNITTLHGIPSSNRYSPGLRVTHDNTVTNTCLAEKRRDGANDNVEVKVFIFSYYQFLVSFFIYLFIFVSLFILFLFFRPVSIVYRMEIHIFPNSL